MLLIQIFVYLMNTEIHFLLLSSALGTAKLSL